jgi:hypothetical protein
MKLTIFNAIKGAGIFKCFIINKILKKSFITQHKNRKKKGGVKLKKTLIENKSSSITLSLSDILELKEIEQQKKEIEQKLIDVVIEIQEQKNVGIFVKINRFMRKNLLCLILFLLKRLEKQIKK